MVRTTPALLLYLPPQDMPVNFQNIANITINPLNLFPINQYRMELSISSIRPIVLLPIKKIKYIIIVQFVSMSYNNTANSIKVHSIRIWRKKHVHEDLFPPLTLLIDIHANTINLQIEFFFVQSFIFCIRTVLFPRTKVILSFQTDMYFST